MEVMIVAVIALIIGFFIGWVVAKRKLHKQCTGSLIFDRAEPKNAPYLAFNSYEELDEIHKKQFATLKVDWTNSDAK